MERFDRNNHHDTHPRDDDESHGHASNVHISHQTHYHTHYHFSVNGNVSQPDQGGRTVTAAGNALINKPVFRVYCKANPFFYLTIRGGNLVMAESDPNNEYQYWYKIDDYNSLKDKDGSPAFSLVNKGSGEAIKHSIGAYHPVLLVPYSPCSFDESILWTEGPHSFDGYRSVRMFNNTHLHMDVFGGGAVHDGSHIILWNWANGDNQKWMIFPVKRL
ncbi:hypothetical protein RIF29_35036 [Crotalaria pallida]|uniref:Ricin B lectin domain-containing protein n=1 Tax=Crotalaria pallida TaxID=3830 RepID=A0AAN9EFF9_CROPI